MLDFPEPETSGDVFTWWNMAMLIAFLVINVVVLTLCYKTRQTQAKVQETIEALERAQETSSEEDSSIMEGDAPEELSPEMRRQRARVAALNHRIE